MLKMLQIYNCMKYCNAINSMKCQLFCQGMRFSSFKSRKALLSPIEVISKKRNCEELSTEEIKYFIDGFTLGNIEDYQCAAFLMAVSINGLSSKETADLTAAMKESGIVADWSSIPFSTVDKHSTGGVGDKISIILAPLVASFGVAVPMMSGRGLGHTGGTLDKLESIPGINVNLSIEKFKKILSTVGCAIVSTTSEIAPADRRMYSIRDVTATVQSIPLQTASIMCKKLAENPDSLVLDVKTGKGSFNQKLCESIELAESMVQAGENDGKQTTAFITNMDQPIGYAVGNWLEVVECLDVMLQSEKAPEDLESLTLVQASQMLVQSGKADTFADALKLTKENLVNGKAMAKFFEMVDAQGGDVNQIIVKYINHSGGNIQRIVKYIDNLDQHLHQDTDSSKIVTKKPQIRHCVHTSSAKKVSALDAFTIGTTLLLGSGRKKIGDCVDFDAGIVLKKKVGDIVHTGLYSNFNAAIMDEAEERVKSAYTFIGVDKIVSKKPLISHVIDSQGVKKFSDFG